MRVQQRIDTVVIGAGQAGLAVSHCLTERGVDHVVLERGRVGARWHSHGWDSLRLLTPNWMSRLPGWSYSGPDPHGYMTAAEVVTYLQSYATASSAPVREDRSVLSVRRGHDGFEVVAASSSSPAARTPCEWWSTRNVVLATGWCDLPVVPHIATGLHPGIVQITPAAYRNPASLPDGGVLVVGASATGVQLADELAAAGRDVVLSVGQHTRLPRRYRGMDIYWWLERIGTLARSVDDRSDPVAARDEPSIQLVGRPDHRNLDLATLRDAGVTFVGRLVGTDGSRARCADDLLDTTAAADARMRRVLDDIDRHIVATGLEAEVLAPDRPARVVLNRPSTRIDLAARGITSVLWATGYRRSYPWLQVPVLDAQGEIRQRAGVTPVPGLYVLGQRFQQRRNSNLIDGVGRDAATVADHLVRRTAPATA